MSALAPTLQAFFTDRLIRQRQASPQTIAAYRDTLRLLLTFAASRTGREPSKLDITELDAPFVAGFLDHLETERGNSVRTRNARLAAIRSLFRYAALRHPEHADLIGRVLAIPPKRCARNLVTFLTEPEVETLLAAPDRTGWTGRRDHALLLLAVQTGLRVSELTGLRCSDVHLGTGAHVSCLGKGRKERITPLIRGTVAVLRVWLAERGRERLGPVSGDVPRVLPLSRRARDAVRGRVAADVGGRGAPTPRGGSARLRAVDPGLVERPQRHVRHVGRCNDTCRTGCSGAHDGPCLFPPRVHSSAGPSGGILVRCGPSRIPTPVPC